jgi:hypothetical protein
MVVIGKQLPPTFSASNGLLTRIRIKGKWIIR